MKDKHTFTTALHERIEDKYPGIAAAISKKDVAILVGEFIDCLKDAIQQDEPIRFHGFGIFELYASKRTKGRNPQTGESIQIPPRKKVKFRTSKSFADSVIHL